MTTANELRAGLSALAKRSVSIMTACANEESAKLYLVLPFLGLLGYDYANPYEVYPEHIADFDPSGLNRVDLAVLLDGSPAIAVEVKGVGSDLSDARGQLRGYFNALPSVKLAILTNGILFEFFVDSTEPNIMDDEPFLTLDLETAARAGVSDEVLETLSCATKGCFDPETVAEAAHIQLVKKRLRTVFVEEAKSPTEGFCRLALDRIGIKSVRRSAIDRYYAPMIKTAFEESLVQPVVERLRKEHACDIRASSIGFAQIGQRVETTERELSVIAYVRRRLAYLADDETHYNAIELVGYKDYVGKLVVFYDRERKGRIFDFIEGCDGFDKFVFPEPIGEIVTNSLTEIDSALKAVFSARVRELGPARAAQGQSAAALARSA